MKKVKDSKVKLQVAAKAYNIPLEALKRRTVVVSRTVIVDSCNLRSHQ